MGKGKIEELREFYPTLSAKLDCIPMAETTP